MRSTLLVLAASLLAASAAPPAPAAEAEDGYRHGRVRYVEPGVTLHRATEVSAEEALANVPFLPGDRVWTDGSGRAEFQFPDGTLVRLDGASKLDYAGHEEGQGERLVLRLWSGSLIVRVRTPQASRFEVETPAGSIALLDQAMLRVDVHSGETRISVYRGEAVVDDGRERVRLAAGERTHARWGGAAAPPESFDIEPEDDFARWDDARESEERWAARSSEYLPAELDPYAGELERNGNWRYEASAGYVWTPSVAAGWSPYSSGHWSWTPYGWTWVPYETWGWAPSHYGRWGFSASFGWYWAPGSVWGPGWVSWGVGHGYVGWCALGWRDKPALPWHGSFNRGYAVPRGGRGNGGWNVVREGDFGHQDIARRRVPLAGIDPQALRIAESPNLRPSRDGRALLASNPSVRAITRRPTPGDFVRELAVDNKTTIPSPWLRSGQARAQPGARNSRDQSNTARRRGAEGGSVAARPGSESATAAEPQARNQGRSRASRSMPWYAPRSESETEAAPPAASSERSTRTRDTQLRDTQAYRRPEPARPRGETQSRESAPTSQSLGASRPRESEPRSYRARPERSEAAAGSDSDGNARQRSSPPRRDEGSSRPQTHRSEPAARDHSSAERSAAPRSDSSSSRSSQGDGGARSNNGGGGSGGGRSAPRPPRQRN